MQIKQLYRMHCHVVPPSEARFLTRTAHFFNYSRAVFVFQKRSSGGCLLCEHGISRGFSSCRAFPNRKASHSRRCSSVSYTQSLALILYLCRQLLMLVFLFSANRYSNVWVEISHYGSDGVNQGIGLFDIAVLASKPQIFMNTVKTN